MLDGLYSVQIHHLASLLPLRQPFTAVYPPFVFISKYGEGEIRPFPEEEKDCWSGKHLSSILCTCGCMWDDTWRCATYVLREISSSVRKTKSGSVSRKWREVLFNSLSPPKSRRVLGHTKCHVKRVQTALCCWVVCIKESVLQVSC